MFNKFRHVLKNHKGFTLVELMVVVVIIGILVAIAVPVYSASTARAQKSACQANQRIIDSAVMQWQTEPANVGYPATLDVLSAYFQATPTCPVAGSHYILPVALGELTTCSVDDHNRK